MALTLFDHAFFAPALHSTSRWPRFGDSFSPRLGGLFAETDARRAAFVDDIDIGQDQPQQGGYSQSYSFSSTTIRGEDGQPITSRTERYEDSQGHRKASTHRAIGSQCITEVHRGEEVSRTVEGMELDQAQEFDKSFQQAAPQWFHSHQQQLEAITEEPQQPVWKAEWDASLADVTEYGFEEAKAREALTQNDGNIKEAIKQLVAQERQTHA